jgi:hypothetical protein
MIDDPIVASVRKIRDELAAAFDYDVHAIFADLRRREAGLGDRLVRQSQTRRPEQPDAAEPPIRSRAVAKPDAAAT